MTTLALHHQGRPFAALAAFLSGIIVSIRRLLSASTKTEKAETGYEVNYADGAVLTKLADTGAFCYVRQRWSYLEDEDTKVFFKCLAVIMSGKPKLIVVDRLNSGLKEGTFLSGRTYDKLLPIDMFGNQRPFKDVPVGAYVFYDGKLCRKTHDGNPDEHHDDRTKYGYVTDVFTGKSENPLKVGLRERVDVIDCYPNNLVDAPTTITMVDEDMK